MTSLWLIVAIVLFAICCFFLPKTKASADDLPVVAGIGFVMCVCWPIFLGIAVFCGPFVGLYFLGKKTFNKAK